MLIKLFVYTGIILFFLLLTGKLYFYNHKNRFIREKSVTADTIIMTIYVFLAVINVFTANISVKPIMLLCAVSPFLIGHFATYEKLTFYTILQLVVILMGILLV